MANIILHDEYIQLGDKLGEGTFAKVYKVMHKDYHYIRVLRELKADKDLDENSSEYKKFQDRTKDLIRLGNGNYRGIVHVNKPFLDKGKACIEMDYIDGVPLKKYIKNKFIPIDEVLKMVEQISDVLAYCHIDNYKFSMNQADDGDYVEPDPFDGSKLVIKEPKDVNEKKLIQKYEVIHNDIHSSNIMRHNVDGHYVLIDFDNNIRGYENAEEVQTRAGRGAYEYMAPEKILPTPEGITPASDIFSFGVVIYEYLTGRVPLPIPEYLKNKGNSDENHNHKISFFVREYDKGIEIPSIYELRKKRFEELNGKKESYEKDYPDWLEEAILRCLKKEQKDRFANGKELHDFVVENIKKDEFEKANKDFSEKIEFLEIQNKNLNQNINTTQRNLELAVADKDTAENRIKDLESENQDLKTDKKSDRKTIDILNDTIGTLHSEKEKLSKDKESLKSDNDKLKKYNDELKNENEDLRKKANNSSVIDGDQIKDLEEENGALRAKEESLSEKNNELSGKLDKANKRIEQLEKTGGKVSLYYILIPIVLVIALVSACVFGFKYKGNYSEIEDKYDSLMIQNTDLNEKYSNLLNEISSDDKDAVIAAKQKEIDELNKQLKEQQNKSNSNDADITALQTEIDNLNKKLTTKQTEIDNLNKTISNLTAENNNLKKKAGNSSDQQKTIDDLNRKIKSLNTEISGLKDTIADKQKYINYLEKTYKIK